MDQRATVWSDCPITRIVVFESPTDATGPTQISIKEGSVGNTGEYRSVGVNLTSPKTKLMKGEKTTINVSVSGLQGLRRPVPASDCYHGSANMQGGNTRVFADRARSGQRERGIRPKSFPLTGTQAGGFSVMASVCPDGRRASSVANVNARLNDRRLPRRSNARKKRAAPHIRTRRTLHTNAPAANAQRKLLMHGASGREAPLRIRSARERTRKTSL